MKTKLMTVALSVLGVCLMSEAALARCCSDGGHPCYPRCIEDDARIFEVYAEEQKEIDLFHAKMEALREVTGCAYRTHPCTVRGVKTCCGNGHIH